MKTIFEYLDGVKLRREAATKGPWTATTYSEPFRFGSLLDDEWLGTVFSKPKYIYRDKVDDFGERNTEFIASMPEDSAKMEQALRVAVEALKFHHDVWQNDRFEKGNCFAECTDTCKSLAEIERVLNE